MVEKFNALKDFSGIMGTYSTDSNLNLLTSIENRDLASKYTS
jgi:hypothetical protein